METETINENVQKGILGAVIGCLLGGVAWVVVGYFGYMAYLVGLLIVFLGAKGYEIGAGTLSKKGLYIVAILSILTALIATYIGWVNFLVFDYNTFFNLSGANQVTMFEMFPVTHEVIFADPSLSSAFWGEMGLALFFVGLPTLFYVINFHRTQKELA